MKKILFILTMLFTLTLTSCETSAQVVYDDGFEYSYYDSEYDRPIVIIDGSYYYRYWLNNAWTWSLVPSWRIPYITHYPTPMRWHRPGWSGRPMGGPRVGGGRIGGQPRMGSTPMRGGGSPRMGNSGMGSRPSGGTRMGSGMQGGSRGSSSRTTVGGGSRGSSMGGARMGGGMSGGSRGGGSMGGGPRGGRGR